MTFLQTTDILNLYISLDLNDRFTSLCLQDNSDFQINYSGSAVGTKWTINILYMLHIWIWTEMLNAKIFSGAWASYFL